jgi:hypothetical protein
MLLAEVDVREQGGGLEILVAERVVDPVRLDPGTERAFASRGDGRRKV